MPRTNFAFSIGDGGKFYDNHWILDSGFQQTLGQRTESTDRPDSKCLTAVTNRGVLRVTKQGSVDIEVVALGVVNTIRLLDA